MLHSNSLLLALAGTSLVLVPLLPAPPATAVQPWQQLPAATESQLGTESPAIERVRPTGLSSAHVRFRLFQRLHATPTGTQASAAHSAWTSPISPIAVVEPFRPPAYDWLPGHRGIDLGAQPGDTVRAAGAGVVTFASDLAGRGVVVIDHGSLRTTYEPVEAEVEVGQGVRAGQRMGTVGTGSGHCGSGRCLHLGLRRGSEYLNPALILWAPLALLTPW